MSNPSKIVLEFNADRTISLVTYTRRISAVTDQIQETILNSFTLVPGDTITILLNDNTAIVTANTVLLPRHDN